MTWHVLESQMLSTAAYEESKSRYFRSHIRDHFRHERMAKLHVA